MYKQWHKKYGHPLIPNEFLKKILQQRGNITIFVKTIKERIMNEDTAILTNEGAMTIFQYKDQRIRFKAPDPLVKYLEIKQWDNGYIVVLTEYKDIGIEEEYIDLVPVLENLYIDKEKFLSPIKHVKIE